MKRWYSLIVLLFCVLVSCSKKQVTQENNTDKITSQKKNSYTVSERVLPKYNNIIIDWQQYQNYRDFLIQNFQNSDKEQVLLNAKELSKLSGSIKDSILPKKIDDVSLKARLNLLNTESLRLYDMSMINSAITQKEVVDQVQKVFDAFSSLNAKVNAMLEREELEKLYSEDIQMISGKTKSTSKQNQSTKPKSKSRVILSNELDDLNDLKFAKSNAKAKKKKKQQNKNLKNE